MASEYRTQRNKIVDAFVAEIKTKLNGQSPFNTNIFNNVHGHTLFIDQITQFPSLCVVAGDESRQYQPDGFKWRFLDLEVRIYVSDETDPQEDLALLLEDIERVIDDIDVLVYDNTVDPSLKTTSSTILTISTDEGVLAPLAVGEIAIQVRY